jgi:hypothetical protein
VKTFLKAIISIALSCGLVFLYTLIIGQKESLIGKADSGSQWMYIGAIASLAYLIYQVILGRIWKK